MLHTSLGPVDVRKPRNPEQIVLHGGLYGKKKGPVTITKQWLTQQISDKSRRLNASSAETEAYRTHVKQAMLVAATRQRLADLTAGTPLIDEATGQPYATPAARIQAQRQCQDQLESWLQGKLPVPLSDQALMGKLDARPETIEERHEVYRKNNRLVKSGKVTSGDRDRYFHFSTGVLKVYHHRRRIDLKPKTYKLQTATGVFEEQGQPGLNEQFHLKGFPCRVRLSLQERPQGPVFLYSTDPRIAKNWERAIRISKFLSTAADSEALRYCVGRTAGVTMTKAWGALVDYYNEIKTIRDQVKILSMRLIRSDISRGWAKAKAVYMSQKAKEAKRQEQLNFVGEMLKERMAAMLGKSNKPPAVLRREAIDTAQLRWRQFRMSRIMERTYPLNNGRVQPRTQQAVVGSRMGAAFQALSCSDALKLVFTGESDDCLRQLSSDPDSFNPMGTARTSGEKVLPALCMVQVTDDLSTLTFAPVDQRAELKSLAKNNWAPYINICDISSVVLHAPRALKQKGKDQELHAGLAGGIWFSIHGPRVSFGKRLSLGNKVIGASNGWQVAADLAQGKTTKWLQVAVTIEATKLPAMREDTNSKRNINQEEAAAGYTLPADEVAHGNNGSGGGSPKSPKASQSRQSFMVLHLLGQRFESNRVTLAPGNIPRFFDDGSASQTLEASIPVPAGLEQLSFLESSEVQIDIMEVFETQAGATRSRAAWAGAVPLIQLFGGTLQQAEQGRDTIPTLSRANEPTGARTLSGEEQGATMPGTMTRASLLPGSAPNLGTGAVPGGTITGTLPGTMPSTIPGSTLTTSSMRSLGSAGRPNASRLRSGTLAALLANTTKPCDTVMRLAPREGVDGSPATVMLSARGAVKDVPSIWVPISPELQGRGPVTSLYTTCRGAWYDPTQSPEDTKFLSGLAPSFLELTLHNLRFPASDRPDSATSHRYHIEVISNGVTISSTSLHRAKPVWQRFLRVDPQKLNFEHARLFVPLPPGAWANASKRPTIEILVVRSAPLKVPAVSFSDFEHGSGVQSHGAPPRDIVYRGGAKLEGLHMDATRQDIRVQLSQASASSPPMTSFRKVSLGDPNEADPASAWLICDACLRDRSYVRLYTQKGPGEGTAPVLCVGEKAILEVEEPLGYPQTAEEYKLRCFPGAFNQIFTRKHALAGDVLPLREPFTTQEYFESDLEKVTEQPFNPAQGNQFLLKSEDIIPHKFVLPTSEQEFKRKKKPGVFHRIVEEQVRASIRAGLVASTGPPMAQADLGGAEDFDPTPVVVKELSHLIAKIPVTVLAIYPNDTCDLEVDEAFMYKWEQSPHKQYNIPGTLHRQYFQDDSAAAIRAAPPGSGDVGERRRGRFLLQGVHLSCVVGQQAASFNIYDARFKGSEAAISVPPSAISNNFSLRSTPPEEVQRLSASTRRGGYGIRAGPVPADAGPLSEYEWTLHCHARSEEEMYQFITNLRLCVQLDHATQKRQLEAARAETAPQEAAWCTTPFSSKSGHFEVVLVQARHLRPRPLQPDQDLWQALKRISQFQMHTSVRFRVVDESGESPKELAYKGSKVQVSTSIPSENPVWASEPNLGQSGGWVFKTPDFDPGQSPGMTLELDVMNKLTTVGSVKIPLTGDPDTYRLASVGVPERDFCSMEDRFTNLWLPLSVRDPNSKVFLVHLMLLWVPLQQDTAEVKRMPTTAKGWRTYLLRPKMSGPESVLREPLTNLQAKRRGYNPNLARSEWPLTRAEAARDYIGMLEDNVPYIACLERQSEAAWRGLLHHLASHEIDGYTLSEIRRQPKETNLPYRINELMRRGVPSSWRRHIWMEILEADHVKSDFAGSEWNPRIKGATDDLREYLDLVRAGRPCKSDSLSQLREDCVEAANWETSPIPGVLDRHMELVSRAQNVCTALITLCRATQAVDGLIHLTHGQQGPYRVVVAYCESLLVLAFFLLIGQAVEPEDPGHFLDQAAVAPRGLERSISTTSRSTMAQAAAVAEQGRADEDRAFWILLALTQSSAFRPYYAAPAPATSGFVQDPAPLASNDGATQDVYRLSLILSRYEPQVWVHLQGLGFQLISFFYGAFMRLFAFHLPPPSLFRFWDFLFAEISDPAWHGTPDVESKIPRRHTLIDLAFGGIQRSKVQLLAAESAWEVKDCLTSCFETLTDPSEVAELVAQTEFFLWEKKSVHKMMIPLHMKEYEEHQPFWELYFTQFKHQNLFLRELMQSMQVNAIHMERARALAAESESQAQAHALDDPTDRRVTTRNLTRFIIPPLVQAWLPGAIENQPLQTRTFSGFREFPGTTGGAHRATPNRLRKIGPSLENSTRGTIRNWASWAYEKALPEQAQLQELPPLPVPLPRPPGSRGEPPTMDRTTFGSHASRVLGYEWGSELDRLFQRFEDRPNGRASLCELCQALICASRGTAGEKAIALFKLHAFPSQELRVRHISPVSHNAHCILEAIEGETSRQSGQIQHAPQADEIPKMALHFIVMTHTTSGRKDELGDVYIPSLQPFTSSGVMVETFQDFVIWEAENRSNQGMNRRFALQQRRTIGEMRMAITWTPVRPNTVEVGQLGIILDSIRFNKHVVRHQDKNPLVRVVTYNGQGHQAEIKRWNPRSTVQSLTQMNTDMMLGSAYGAHIEFPATKWRDSLGYLHDRGLGLAHHGWNTNERSWMWDRRIGAQYSIENLELFNYGSHRIQDPVNTISLKACRSIAEGILRRSFHYLTNRQASLLADQAFSRAGAVAGILEAILVKDSMHLAECDTLPDVHAARARGDLELVDVRHHLILAHEESVAANAGSLNLFGVAGSPTFLRNSWSPMEGCLNLSDLQIYDPYSGYSKVLWIRHARAGDGQRFSTRYSVDKSGYFESNELQLDMDATSAAGKIQTVLTKEEFVSCLITNPLLSEGLRQMTTFDTSSQLRIDRPLSIELAIEDPMQESADEDFLDSMNVRQTLCFELYDVDRASLSDFLGECWLPNFTEITAEPKVFILEVQPPGDGSRPDTSHKDPTKSYTGWLSVSLAWKYPEEGYEELQNVNCTTLEERAALEEKLHTGLLSVKILKAEGLRNADVFSNGILNRGMRMVRREEDLNDVCVWVYQKNEAFHSSDTADLPPGIGKAGWKVNMAGMHDPVYRTKTINNSVMPEWNEAFSLKLQTGNFEKRTKQRRHFDLSRRAAARHRNEAFLSTMSTDNELIVNFQGDPQETRQFSNNSVSRNLITAPSYNSTSRFSFGSTASAAEPDRHGVQVFMGDSIFEFKAKVREACRIEAEAEAEELARLTGHDAAVTKKRRQAFEEMAKSVSGRYVVLIFVPSPELRDLARAHRTNTVAYKNRYAVDFNDPSSWQPLDDSKTFEHFSLMYGITPDAGLIHLRLVLGSDQYQTKNSRYRQFVLHQQQRREKLEEVNSSTECFGFAKFVHRHDGGSTEWRPVLAERRQAAMEGQPGGFPVSFVHCPVVATAETRTGSLPEEMTKAIVDEASLLLAPLDPVILESAASEHQRYLLQAPKLAAEGRSEADIVKILNDRMDAQSRARRADRHAQDEEGSEEELPPPITLRDVRRALRR